MYENYPWGRKDIYGTPFSEHLTQFQVYSAKMGAITRGGRFPSDNF